MIKAMDDIYKENQDGESILVRFIKEEKVELMLKPLLHGYDPTRPTSKGPPILFAIQKAIEAGNFEMLKMLVVFGGHVIPEDTSEMPNADYNLKHMTRQYKKTIEVDQSIKRFEETMRILDALEIPECKCPSCTSAKQAKQSAELSNGSDPFVANAKDFLKQLQGKTSENSRIGTKVLALDGGGIKGLIAIQMLLHIERKLNEMKKPGNLSKRFDFLSGTSTGSILSLALTRGFRVNNTFCLSIKSFILALTYFKNFVFFDSINFPNSKLISNLIEINFSECNKSLT